MGAPSTPEPGDIVVHHGGNGTFVLRVEPGPDQIVVQTRDAAIDRARMFAKLEQVRVWLTNGDNDFTLLEDFSVRTGPRHL